MTDQPPPPHSPVLLTQSIQPTLIPHFDFPPLTQTNIIQWTISVESHAAVHDILPHIIGPPPAAPDPDDHVATKKYQHDLSLARLLVVPHISPEILKGISPAVLSGHPSGIYQHLKTKLSLIPPQHSEANLRYRATQLKHHPPEAITEYISRHRELRDTMLQTGFPNIDDETTTVQFVIDGLKHLPDWHSLIRELSNFHNFHNGRRPSLELVFTMLVDHAQAVQATSPPFPQTTSPATQAQPYPHIPSQYAPTIHMPHPPHAQTYLRTRGRRGRGHRRITRPAYLDINTVTPPPPNHRGLWCTYHGSPTHDTAHCYTRRNLLNLAHPKQPTQHTHHALYSIAPPPHYAAYQTNDSTAIQYMPQLPHQPLQEPIPLPTQPQLPPPPDIYHLPPTPQQTSTATPHPDSPYSSTLNTPSTSSYLLDSGAFPTHLQHPHPTMRPTRQHTVTASGQLANISHTGSVNIPITKRRHLHIAKAVTLPGAKHNLLSVSQLAHNYDITFQKRTAYVTTRQPPPPTHTIVATAPRKNNLYHLQPEPHTELNPHHHSLPNNIPTTASRTSVPCQSPPPPTTPTIHISHPTGANATHHQTLQQCHGVRTVDKPRTKQRKQNNQPRTSQQPRTTQSTLSRPTAPQPIYRPRLTTPKPFQLSIAPRTRPTHAPKPTPHTTAKQTKSAPSQLTATKSTKPTTNPTPQKQLTRPIQQHQPQNTRNTTSHNQNQAHNKPPIPGSRPSITKTITLPNRTRRHRPPTTTTKPSRKTPQLVKTMLPPVTIVPTQVVQDYHNWHIRLGHLHPQRIHFLAKHNLVAGLPHTLKNPPPTITCTGCAMGKQPSAPFHLKIRTAPLGSHIHTDVCGPLPTPSISGNRYFATFTDEKSRYLHVHFSPQKNTAAHHLKQHIERIHALSPLRVTDVTMDNAPEYFSTELVQFYNSHHISTHPTVPYTPQENAISERVNRSLMDISRALLLTSGMPHQLWEYAVRAAADYINHSPHTSHHQIPLTIWNGTIPDLATFRKFGEPGYVHDRKPGNKLMPKATLLYYIGRVDPRHYYVYNKNDNRVHRCRAADFRPYDPNKDPIATVSLITRPPTANHAETTSTAAPATNTYSDPKNLKQARQAPDATEWEKSWNSELDNLEKRGTITYIPQSQVPPGTTLLPIKTVLKTKRDSDGRPVARKTRCNIRGDLQKPNEHYDPDNISSPVADRDAVRLALALAAAHNYEVHHWDLDSAFLHEAFGDDKTLYIYQPKRFDGTYKYPGFVGKVTGNMYGAKQACQIFTKGLSNHLHLTDFQRISSDSCTFMLTSPHDRTQFVLLIITIDDFMVVSNNPELREHTKRHLQTKYLLKDLGPVSHILGWKVERTTQGIKISQPAYTKQLLSKYNLTDAKPAKSPIASDLLNTTEKLTQPLDTKQHNFLALIGSLRYLADSTRPDIAFITGYLGRFSQNPQVLHWQAALRVLRYLKTDPNLGITYPTTLNTTLQAYSDSDFAACTETRRSTSGTVILYNNAPIAWQSKRQRFVATSTWHAEYVAAFHTSQHLNFIRNLLQDLNHGETKSTPLRMDNAGAITTANTQHPTPKSKHIDVKYHYLKEQVQRRHITLHHTPSEHNAADIMTKALKPAQYVQKLPLLRLT